ncbi:hypothetical protein OESDEN_01018 [Oesophagostomum dentatum]|uniref:L-Fucosyltransferase n=1 Tax=Oesophagostomum dentatum TaxID=61180 RepID=A0A0B1TN76_OESDE|nr:hypothetical protein OESDEN_01018 [Oesophagostomum dentatum]
MACCEYEDPSRLENRTEQFLVLEIHYAQNVRYFQHMLPEIRYLLEFSDKVKREGNKVVKRWKMWDLSEFLIFGDDTDFMRRMEEALQPNKARYSSNSEGVDFYVASRVCGAFLMTAPTSTFGWWLAFFSPNQDAIYYNNDFASIDDKKANKDLFLWSVLEGIRRQDGVAAIG